MKKHVVILGAGFGGLELSTRLSEVDDVRVTLIDQNDSFVFGFSKLDVMTGRKTKDEVRLSYRDLRGDFRQEQVTSIDPANRVAITDRSTYEADVLVVALGAEYEPSATPGFVEGGHEYYSLDGADRLREVLPSVTHGTVVVAILKPPFKCPPAPFEGALLLHEYWTERGVRDAIDMRVISPLPSPIPVSPTASQKIVHALDERGIAYSFEQRVTALDGNVARLANGDAVECALFIGVPAHRVPRVVKDSGLTEGGTDGWVHVDQGNLETPYPNVYAIGDVADAPVPRAGVFAETAARAVADDIAARLRGDQLQLPYDGRGSCYIEFGGGLVGKVDADFLSGPSPIAPFLGPSAELAREKEEFARTRARRWFGVG